MGELLVSGRVTWMIILHNALPKTDSKFTPENRPGSKRSPGSAFPTIKFRGLCSAPIRDRRDALQHGGTASRSANQSKRIAWGANWSQLPSTFAALARWPWLLKFDSLINPQNHQLFRISKLVGSIAISQSREGGGRILLQGCPKTCGVGGSSVVRNVCFPGCRRLQTAAGQAGWISRSRQCEDMKRIEKKQKFPVRKPWCFQLITLW